MLLLPLCCIILNTVIYHSYHSQSWLDFRLEAGSSCLNKHSVGAAPSLGCNQKSPPLREGSDGSKTISFSPIATRLSRRKKSKQNTSTKSKEDENNLGEQLLKEFADFQSSRSDKVDGCEESEKVRIDDQSEAPGKANLPPTELPTEKEKTSDQEGESNPKVPSNESTPTVQPRQETQTAGLENTNPDQVSCPGAAAGAEEALAGDEGHGGAGQVEMEMETRSGVELEAEPAISSEGLAVNVCHSDSNLKEVNKEALYNNESCALRQNSAPVPLVRSTTIPGLVPPVSSVENTYTITELAPAPPMDLTSLVSSMCSVDEYNLDYPDPTYASATSWSAQTPNSSMVQGASVWGSTEITQHGFVQQDTDCQGKMEGHLKPLTVFLPPVATRKEAEKQLMNFVNEG